MAAASEGKRKSVGGGDDGGARRAPKRLKLNEHQAELLYWAKVRLLRAPLLCCLVAHGLGRVLPLAQSVLRKQIAALPAKANIIGRDKQYVARATPPPASHRADRRCLHPTWLHH
eukprot:COSAG06_NODE_10176_length_1735_cov_1.132641_2_plen_115_part_00